MESSLILLLLILLLFAILSYYIGFARSRHSFPFNWGAQAAFIFLVFILIPACITVLCMQKTAINRLAKTGITPHPAIKESVGVATGIGTKPIWMFKVNTQPEDISDFYRKDSNRQGWTLVNNNPLMIICARGKQKMVITIYKSWAECIVTYMLTES